MRGEMPPSHAIGSLFPTRREHMKADEGQDQDAAFPGSMEAGAASGNIAACRAQAELVEALARLVLDSVAKTNDGERNGKPQAGTPRARLGTRRT
jgi:hypothetical protein